MPLEIEIFLISEDLQAETKVEIDPPLSLQPGEFYHIPNINFHDDSHEVYAIKCKDNDKMTTIHKLTHVVDFEGINAPMVLFDRSNTENRAIVIEKGQERDLRIRQEFREGKKTSIRHARFHLTHK